MQERSADSPDELGLIRHSPKAAVPGAPRSVADVLDGPCRRRPDHVALVGVGARYSYVELDIMANRAANALAGLGIGPGDRVAASLPNHPDIVIAFLGAMRLGAVWVGLNRVLAPPEMAVLLTDSGASVLLSDRSATSFSAGSWSGRVVTAAGDGSGEWGDLLSAAATSRPGIRVDPLAPAAIAYTSGTTGQPKGAVHSQHNLVTFGAMNRVDNNWRAVPCQAAVLALTILNLMVLAPLLVWQLDGTCVCVERPDPETIARWVRDEQVQSFSAVPTIVYDLVSSPAVSAADFESLTTIGAGGMALSAELRARYKERFGKEVLPSYGLTEAPTAVTGTDPNRTFPPGSSGRALPHVELTIRDPDGRVLPAGDEGEICVAPAGAGPLRGVYTPFLGYWGRPDATVNALRGGVLHTGDVGSLGEQGDLFVRGRTGDMIIRAGTNVYPAEVELVLAGEPSIAAAAVVGRPDERLGQRIVAFVQPAGDAGVDPADLRAYCVDRLTRTKVPDRFVVVEDMPRNAMGKVIKAALREPDPPENGRSLPG